MDKKTQTDHRDQNRRRTSIQEYTKSLVIVPLLTMVFSDKLHLHIKKYTKEIFIHTARVSWIFSAALHV